jgi:sigma-B regulation protein RsbU (phosphoserine phosphatase)
MEQRKLYRTLDNIIKEAPNYTNIEELLVYVIKQIISLEDINIIGGRLWKLNDNKTGYRLVEQIGDVEHIDKNYHFTIRDYPTLKEIGRQRTIVARETDAYLIKKGIHKYSATGVGEKFKVKDKKNNNFFFLYNYLIAFNGRRTDEEFLNTLNIISVMLSSVIRTKRIEKRERENIEELEKASDIQKSILPEHELIFGNYEIFGISVPEKIVGGDFFDYIKISDDYKLVIAIGDAASKGVSAAAQALYVSGALKMGVDYDISSTSLIRKINNLVYDTFPFERFVTLFYCELYKDKKGLCVYINAGHNSPLFFKNTSGAIEDLITTGPVLGPVPNQTYYTESFNLNLNDILVLYTDGIIEAANKHFEFYGEPRLKKLLTENNNSSAKEICEKIIEDVQMFSADGKYSDDKTVVVIKRIN